MFDIEEDNFTTNASSYANYSDSYGRKDFPLIQLYLVLPLRLTMSLAIVISAGIVLWAIKKSKRITTTLHFFFIANLMIADIGVAVIHNGAIIVDKIVRIANPVSKGTDCNIIRVSAFSITANTMMLTALCFDRLYSIIAPHHYRRNMTKRRGCVIVLAIWIISFLLSSVSFLDPHVHSKNANVICGSSLYKNSGLIVATIPLFLSAVFVVIQNIYLYCVVVRTTSRSGGNNNTTAAGMWRILKETKKASIILLILSGTSIFFGIIQQVTLAVVQSKIEYSMGKVIVYSLVMPFIGCINILLHSLLYGYFLHSIRESLGLNNCQCFCTMSE